MFKGARGDQRSGDGSGAGQLGGQGGPVLVEPQIASSTWKTRQRVGRHYPGQVLSSC
jgi:hypothetical protein